MKCLAYRERAVAIWVPQVGGAGHGGEEEGHAQHEARAAGRTKSRQKEKEIVSSWKTFQKRKHSTRTNV